MKLLRYSTMLFVFELFMTDLFLGQWVPQNSNTQASLNDVIMLDQQTGIAVGDSGKILKTLDAGQNWIEEFSAANVRWNALAFANAMKGAVVGDSCKIAFTFDGGENWTFIDSSSTTHLTAADYMGETTLYVGDNSGSVFYTNNDGITWNLISFGNEPVMDIFFTESAYIDYSGHVILPWVDYETLDSGSNWQPFSLPFTSWGFATTGDFSPSAAVSFIVGADGQFLSEPVILRKSATDTSWQKYAFMPIPPITGLCDVSVPNDQIAYACGTFGHILKTVDGGNFWNVDFAAISTDLNAIDFYDDSTGVVVGDSGIILFTTTGGAMGLDDNEKMSLRDFVLYQNYPNPFNPETTIGFYLPHSAEVRLEIFNALGQKIRAVIAGRKIAGVHQMKWDGRDELGREASSGVYIYRLKAEDQILSKKMLLLH